MSILSVICVNFYNEVYFSVIGIYVSIFNSVGLFNMFLGYF